MWEVRRFVLDRVWEAFCVRKILEDISDLVSSLKDKLAPEGDNMDRIRDF
jgi:hypothetical protein